MDETRRSAEWRRRGYDTVQLGAGELAAGVTLLGDNSGADTNPVMSNNSNDSSQ